MHYKTQSILTIAAILGFMVVVAVLINSMQGQITGAATADANCKCTSSADCNDSNPCTEDICLYPENCGASLCVNKNIEGCTQ